jgi:hypothetical protein
MPVINSNTSYTMFDIAMPNDFDGDPQSSAGALAVRKISVSTANARDKVRKSQEDFVGILQGGSKKVGSKLRGLAKSVAGDHTGGKPNFISRNESTESLDSGYGRKASPRKNEADDDDDENDDGPTGIYDDTSDIVRRRNNKYQHLGAFLASFARACYFETTLDRYYGRRPDVILKMMEKEFESFGRGMITSRQAVPLIPSPPAHAEVFADVF